MYVCQPGLVMRGICLLLVLFLAPEIGLCLWLAGDEGFSLRLYAWLGVVLFGGLELALVRRMFFLGLAWLEYDDRRLVLHFNRREERALLWDDLGEVRIYQDGRNLIFDGLGRRRLVITPMYEGWRDLRDELRDRGLLPGEVDLAAVWEDCFSQQEQQEPGWHFYKKQRR